MLALAKKFDQKHKFEQKLINSLFTTVDRNFVPNISVLLIGVLH